MFPPTLRPPIGGKRSGGGCGWSLWRHGRRWSRPTSRSGAPTAAHGPTSTWTTRRARRPWPASWPSSRTSRRGMATRTSRGSGPLPMRPRTGPSRSSPVRARAPSCSCATRRRRPASSPRRCPRARASSPPRARTRSRGASTTSPSCRLRPTARSWWSAASTRCGSRASPIDLVAITGASSVTGEVWPLAELAAVARHYGAQLFVDATQLASHRAIDMAETGIDYLALSGDMLYAPFGSAALVACGRALAHARAGVRNVVGAVALGAACRTLGEVGMDHVAAHERGLLARLARGAGRRPRPAVDGAVRRPRRRAHRPGDVRARGLPPRAAGRDPRRRARDRRRARRVGRACA